MAEDVLRGNHLYWQLLVKSLHSIDHPTLAKSICIDNNVGQ